MTADETHTAGAATSDDEPTERGSGDVAEAAGAEPGEQPAADSVLVVADHPNVGKIERHYGPLADVVGETTMVCIQGDRSVEGISFVEVPAPGHRLLGLPFLLLVGLLEAVRGEYDAVVSISLVPYGLFALLTGRLTATPVHLGIIGADIDSHARAWYGALPRAAFRRFDSVSVPGTTHVDRLVEAGVDPARVSVLTNAIDTAEYRPAVAAEPEFDFVWVGRFSKEKAPLRFVEALAELDSRGRQFSAVMLGDGDRMPEVRREVDRRALSDRVALPGWVDTPVTYYRRARVFVLTSRRDALPLTLVETMATGLVPVVPPVGSVTDVAEHEFNAIVVEDRRATTLADGMERLLESSELRERLAEQAPGVRKTCSYAAARTDWREILGVLGA